MTLRCAACGRSMSRVWYAAAAGVYGPVCGGRLGLVPLSALIEAQRAAQAPRWASRRAAAPPRQMVARDPRTLDWVESLSGVHHA